MYIGEGWKCSEFSQLKSRRWEELKEGLSLGVIGGGSALSVLHLLKDLRKFERGPGMVLTSVMGFSVP